MDDAAPAAEPEVWAELGRRIGDAEAIAHNIGNAIDHLTDATSGRRPSAWATTAEEANGRSVLPPELADRVGKPRPAVGAVTKPVSAA